jgi:hypothetical protein
VPLQLVILENQERAQKEDAAFLNEAAPTNATGSSVAKLGSNPNFFS